MTKKKYVHNEQANKNKIHKSHEPQDDKHYEITANENMI